GNRHPGEKVVRAAAWILRRDVRNRAIRLLPHLIKTMNRIACVTRVSGVRDRVGEERLPAVVEFGSAYERVRPIWQIRRITTIRRRTYLRETKATLTRFARRWLACWSWCWRPRWCRRWCRRGKIE